MQIDTIDTIAQTPNWTKLFRENDYYNFVVLAGGRDCGKSVAICDTLVLNALNEPNVRILCLRENMSNIEESSKEELVKSIRRCGFSDFFRITKYSITGKNGSEFVFKGMELMEEGLQGLSGFKYAYIDEGQFITADPWEKFVPTISRNTGFRVYISLNPRFMSDPIYEDFFVKEPLPKSLVMRLTYRNNPWFDDDRKALRERFKRNNPLRYPHVWEGELDYGMENRIFDIGELEANIVNEFPFEIKRTVRAYDVASTKPSKKNRDPDHTVGLKLGTDNEGNYALLDIERFRDSVGGVIENMKRIAATDTYDTMIYIEEEPGSSGQVASSTFSKALDGYIVNTEKSTGNKMDRARLPASIIANGNMYVKRNKSWYPAFRDELAAAPNGVHDDQIDALSLACESLRYVGGVYASWD